MTGIFGDFAQRVPDLMDCRDDKGRFICKQHFPEHRHVLLILEIGAAFFFFFFSFLGGSLGCCASGCWAPAFDAVNTDGGPALLKPAANDVLRRWPVSRRVNSSRAPADDPTLIERVEVK